METRLNIRVDEETKARFDKRCRELDVSLSDWLRVLGDRKSVV